MTQPVTSHPYIMSFEVVAASCLCFPAALSAALVSRWLEPRFSIQMSNKKMSFLSLVFIMSFSVNIEHEKWCVAFGKKATKNEWALIQVVQMQKEALRTDKHVAQAIFKFRMKSVAA